MTENFLLCMLQKTLLIARSSAVEAGRGKMEGVLRSQDLPKSAQAYYFYISILLLLLLVSWRRSTRRLTAHTTPLPCILYTFTLCIVLLAVLRATTCYYINNYFFYVLLCIIAILLIIKITDYHLLIIQKLNKDSFDYST